MKREKEERSREEDENEEKREGEKEGGTRGMRVSEQGSSSGVNL